MHVWKHKDIQNKEPATPATEGAGFACQSRRKHRPSPCTTRERLFYIFHRLTQFIGLLCLLWVFFTILLHQHTQKIKFISESSQVAHFQTQAHTNQWRTPWTIRRTVYVICTGCCNNNDFMLLGIVFLSKNQAQAHYISRFYVACACASILMSKSYQTDQTIGFPQPVH